MYKHAVYLSLANVASYTTSHQQCTVFMPCPFNILRCPTS